MTWLLDNLDVVASYLVSHLVLAIPPIICSLVLSVPLAWVAVRVPWLRGIVVSGASLTYAIPSLPLFIALPLVLATGLRDSVNIVVALTLYGMALMVPATVNALGGIPPRVVDAANALGYGPVRRFFVVDLPLAGPTILAGLRVVAVSTVSLVTVGAVLGIPSLGLLFTDGFQRSILESLVTGLVATVALALVFDGFLVLAGRALLPWTRTAAR